MRSSNSQKVADDNLNWVVNKEAKRLASLKNVNCLEKRLILIKPLCGLTTLLLYLSQCLHVKRLWKYLSCLCLTLMFLHYHTIIDLHLDYLC